MGPRRLGCLSLELGWTALDPIGLLYGWEQVWHPSAPALIGACPYVVVIVELPHADGMRMIGHLATAPIPSPGRSRWRSARKTTAPTSRHMLSHWAPAA